MRVRRDLSALCLMMLSVAPTACRKAATAPASPGCRVQGSVLSCGDEARIVTPSGPAASAPVTPDSLVLIERSGTDHLLFVEAGQTDYAVDDAHSALALARWIAAPPRTTAQRAQAGWLGPVPSHGDAGLTLHETVTCDPLHFVGEIENDITRWCVVTRPALHDERFWVAPKAGYFNIVSTDALFTSVLPDEAERPARRLEEAQVVPKEWAAVCATADLRLAIALTPRLAQPLLQALYARKVSDGYRRIRDIDPTLVPRVEALQTSSIGLRVAELAGAPGGCAGEVLSSIYMDPARSCLQDNLEVIVGASTGNAQFAKCAFGGLLDMIKALTSCVADEYSKRVLGAIAKAILGALRGWDAAVAAADFTATAYPMATHDVAQSWTAPTRTCCDGVAAATPTVGAGVKVFQTIGQSAGNVRIPTSATTYSDIDAPELYGIKFMLPVSRFIDESDAFSPDYVETILNFAMCHDKKAIVSLMAVYPNYATVQDLPPYAIPEHWVRQIPTVRYAIPRDRDPVRDTPVPVIWDDRFQELYANALKKLARVYDGDPRIDHVEIGVGTWGETFLDLRFFEGTAAQKEAAVCQWRAAGWSLESWRKGVERTIEATAAAFRSTPKALMITDLGWQQLPSTTGEYSDAALRQATDLIVDVADRSGIEILQYNGLRPGPAYPTDWVMFDVLAARQGHFTIGLEAFGPSGNSYATAASACWVDDPACVDPTALTNLLSWAQRYHAASVTLWPADVHASTTGADYGHLADAVAGTTIEYIGCVPPSRALRAECVSQVGGCWPMIMTADAGQRFEAWSAAGDGTAGVTRGLETRLEGSCTLDLPDRAPGAASRCTCETVFGTYACIPLPTNSAVSGCIHNLPQVFASPGTPITCAP